MTVRDDARTAFERFFANVLELDLDFCNLTYGNTPCQAGLVVTDTAQAGSTTSITLAAADTAQTNEYIAFLVFIESGTGVGQQAQITAYDSSTKIASAVFGTAPDNTSVYRIHRSRGQVIHSGTPPSASSQTVVRLSGESVPVNDFYNGMLLKFQNGAAGGTYRTIIDFDGPTRFATVNPGFDATPLPIDEYIVINPLLKANCYNTFNTCQDKLNYDLGTKTYQFTGRGVRIPAGIPLRPGIDRVRVVPTRIELEKGVAQRNSLTVTLIDESDADVGVDPYLLNRLDVPAGSYWTRLLTRNPFYAGRFARLRKGYVVEPWDWATFQNELYIIDAINGPDMNGSVNVVLKDMLKLADRNKTPVATDGQLTVEFKAQEDAGFAVAATLTTITLRTEASPLDEFYTGMNIKIVAGLGPEQEREILSYVGATRVATVAAWELTPDSTSVYEVERVSITLDAGKAVQYTDPVVSGEKEYIRIDKEIIEYTAISGDVLSWPSVTNRAQFGSTRADHRQDANVQLCHAWNNKTFDFVIQDLLNVAGIPNANIDLTLLQDEVNTWLRGNYNITAIISKPESPTRLLQELCFQSNTVLWWSPIAQKVQFKFIAQRPPGAGPVPLITDENGLIEDSVSVIRQENLRITSTAMYYDIADATESLTEAKNFLLGRVQIDTDAESVNEYNDQRPSITFSRWLTDINSIGVNGWVGRRLGNRRDAPKIIKTKIDPKDFTFDVGELIDIETAQLVDDDGNPSRLRVLVSQLTDNGDTVDLELMSTTFGRRYGFIAPNGFPNFPSATEAQKEYAFIADSITGLMSDGTNPYLII